jgi:hypothetical protein
LASGRPPTVTTTPPDLTGPERAEQRFARLRIEDHVLIFRLDDHQHLNGEDARGGDFDSR